MRSASAIWTSVGLEAPLIDCKSDKGRMIGVRQEPQSNVHQQSQLYVHLCTSVRTSSLQEPPKHMSASSSRCLADGLPSAQDTAHSNKRPYFCEGSKEGIPSKSLPEQCLKSKSAKVNPKSTLPPLLSLASAILHLSCASLGSVSAFVGMRPHLTASLQQWLLVLEGMACRWP